jgi:hypothetical protein
VRTDLSSSIEATQAEIAAAVAAINAELQE